MSKHASPHASTDSSTEIITCTDHICIFKSVKEESRHRLCKWIHKNLVTFIALLCFSVITTVVKCSTAITFYLFICIFLASCRRHLQREVVMHLWAVNPSTTQPVNHSVCQTLHFADIYYIFFAEALTISSDRSPKEIIWTEIEGSKVRLTET